MPIPEPNFSESPQDDALNRQLFIEWVEAVLAAIVQDPASWNIHPELRQSMKEAFTDVPDALKQLESKLKGLESNGVLLHKHGLVGAQLNFKLRTMTYWANRVNQSAIGTWGMRRLLNVIDTFLDSMLAATGVGTLVKEYKDTVKEAIDKDSTE